jgi:diguanylate cyclase (GGDEF)-like protein
MDELNEKNDDYCLMSLDLNGLKEVNDRFGHLAGDQYIKEFSEVLKSVFGDGLPICRVGGDEFMVFLHGTDEDRVKDYISEIYDLTGKIRLKSGDYPCSAAAGFAFRREIHNEKAAAHEVYMLADERMYTEKRRLHKELGISIREK